jgi:hypothetical protein
VPHRIFKDVDERGRGERIKVSAIFSTVHCLRIRELQIANYPLYGEDFGMGGPRTKFIGQIPLITLLETNRITFL